MGGAAAERMARRGVHAHLSHAVAMDTLKPVCRKVKISSLVDDSSTFSDELPDCPDCRKRLKQG